MNSVAFVLGKFGLESLSRVGIIIFSCLCVSINFERKLERLSVEHLGFMKRALYLESRCEWVK